MSALRTTWQVSRPQFAYPALGVATTGGTSLVVVGRYIGDQVAASALIMQPQLGVPFVAVDAFAFLPVSADVQEGDTLTDLERGTVWEAKDVRTFVTRRIVGIKSVKTKSKKP